MKRCTKYIDFVNSDSFDSEMPSKEYSDILLHSESCADCSFDRKNRETIISSLNHSSEVQIPNQLHENIIYYVNQNGISSENEEKEGMISNVFNSLLRPLEILVPLACVFMFVCMFQINNENNIEVAKVDKNVNNQNIQNQNTNLKEIQKVTPGEVEEFLVKLDEFNKQHNNGLVDINTNNKNYRLVGDKR